MLRKVRFFTGPTLVKTVCDRAIAAGYADVIEGTEHMFVNLVDNEDGWGVLEAVHEFNKKIDINLGYPSNVYGPDAVVKRERL